MIKLIVFDLGETLVNYKGVQLDWSNHYELALKLAFENTGIDYTVKMISKASSILLKYNTRINPRVEEVSAKTIFGEILREINSNDEVVKIFIEKFFEYFQRETEIETTAVDLLESACRYGIKTAVLTDVPYGMPKYLMQKDLDSIAKYIDLIVSSEEVGFRKPSSKGLRSLLNHFNISPLETFSVGNEKKDIDMANSIGVFSVLLSRDIDIPSWGQNKTISRLIELNEFIE